MRTHELNHLSDHELLRDLAALVAQDRTTAAALHAHLAEVDARRLPLPAAIDVAAPDSEAKPDAPERYELRLTIGQAMYDKLQDAQALLGDAIHPGDVAEVLDRALDVFLESERP